MDVLLQSQFQRVETALSTLVDSIASYNPNPQAAIDLVAADDELGKGLEQLARHQANHARILSLRNEVDALEAQLKSSISALAELRNEIFENPATTVSEASRPVPLNELLQYAKNISRCTVPPTYREPIPKGDSDNEKEKDDAASSGIPSNGLSTPLGPPGNLVVPDPTSKDTAAPEEPEKQVTTEQAEWLTKLHEAGVQWVPWPSHDKIRKGGLMVIQDMIDRGQNPKERLLPAEQELLDKQKQEAAELEQKQKEEVQKEYERKMKEAAQGSKPDAQRGPAVETKTETFAGFDFDDED